MSAEQYTSFLSAARFGRSAAQRAMGVAAMIGTVLEQMIAAHERWRQRQALLALDDHLLKDIGVSRVDVEREAAKRPWEE